MESACSCSHRLWARRLSFYAFHRKDSVPKERKETPTKFEITPNETDVERYKALYDERLQNLEGSLKEASAREKHFTKELERLKEELHKNKRKKSVHQKPFPIILRTAGLRLKSDYRRTNRSNPRQECPALKQTRIFFRANLPPKTSG